MEVVDDGDTEVEGEVRDRPVLVAETEITVVEDPGLRVRLRLRLRVRVRVRVRVRG